MQTLRAILAAALRRFKFFRAVAEVATSVPDYDLDAETTLTPEEEAWLEEWIAENS